MNYPAILFAFILPFNLSMAEEGKAKTNPLFLSLEQYAKVEKAPVGLVTASHEKDQWNFSIPSNRSEYNFSQELKRVVLRGDGFEIPVAAGSAFDNGQRTKFAITAKMRESAALEIWMLTTHQGGSRAEYFKIKLADIPPKREDGSGNGG
jgi:hypothetical protein